MNLRQPLNIWRVYLDLFANLVGVIAIGGAGVMAMVGGAVATAGPGASAWPLDCRNGEELDSTRLLHPLKRRSIINAGQLCQREAVYTDLQFKAEDGKLAEFLENDRTSFALEQACDDLLGLVEFRRKNEIEGMVIELVGRSTAQWSNTESCRTSFSADQEVRKGMAGRHDLTPEQRDVVKKDIESRRSMEPEAAVIDRSICNGQVEQDRGRAVLRACAAEAINRGDISSREINTVDVVTSGGEDTDLVMEACRTNGVVNTGDDYGGNCLRTVTIRVKLPPRGIGWAPPPGSPNG